MRIIVCGGRDFTLKNFLYSTLDKMHAANPITCVIHGDARGADSLAHQWAISKGINVVPMPADWTRYGNSAGPIRNCEMLLQAPDMVVVFRGGKGTAHMVAVARKKGVKVLEVL